MSNWISVDDRLPDFGRFLVWYMPLKPTLNKDGGLMHISIGRRHPNEKGWGRHGQDEHGIYPIGVTHWMPLPDPPGYPKTVPVEVVEILSLIICAPHYGWDRPMLMQSFWEMLGENLTDTDIDAAIEHGKRSGGDYDQEDFDEWRGRLEEFRDRYESD